MSGKSNSEEFVFGLAMYMLTSARGLVDEPSIYGPLRLIESISRLVDLPDHAACVGRDAFLNRMKKQIDENKYVVMDSEEKFVVFLDGLIKEFAAELKRRHATH